MNVKNEKEIRNVNDGGSSLLKAVELIAINAADAKALVSKYKTKAKQSKPDANDREIIDIVVKKIISRYAKLSATSGGATALTGVVPGIGTALALVGGGLTDATISMKFQVDMTMCIAEAMGWDMTNEDARRATYLIVGMGALEKFGIDEGTKLASKAGVKLVKKYLSGAVLMVTKEIFQKFGITFTRKAFEKALPLGIGVVIGASFGYALTKYVGKATYQWFIIEGEENARSSDVEEMID